MKRLLDLIKNKIFLGLLGVIALGLVIWFGADFVKFGEDNATLSPTVRLILILGVLLIWLVIQMISMFLSQRRNSGMLNALQESQVNPDEEKRDQELAALNQRFRDGMAILRKAKFDSSNGKVALYQLPWYIIIGPPGAGKTTALVNSGLEFPLADSHGKGALGGIGGTRNCDWWFTNEAVLIDTAGRYTTQDSHKVVDNSAWQTFLTLLKKYRPRRPVNGALIAISVQDLMTQQPAQRSHAAKQIRERIDELQKAFGIQVPIYVLLTKCDLLAGFTDFFANLTQPERQQIWGVTFNAKAGKQQDAQQGLASLPAELDELVLRLNQRVLWRVHNERDPAKRALIQGFPLQVEALKPLVSEFMNEAFSANRFSDAPVLRGVYLCSGTQEGTPIDRMMAAVSANFGLSREVLRNAPGGGKSFFLNRLFRTVVIPESELVGSNRQVESSLLWLRRVYFGLLVLVVVGALAVWTATVKRNDDFMAQVSDLTGQFKTARDGLNNQDRELPSTLPSLNPLRSAAGVYNQEEHPWLSGMGLYDASVDAAADKLYHQALQKDYLPRFGNLIEQHLNSLNADDQALIDTLRAYLMLGDPGHFDAGTVKRWAQQQWVKQYPGEASKQQELMDHLTHLLGKSFEPLALNAQVVESARMKARQIPAAQRLYSQLKAGPLGQEQLDLYAQMGAKAAAQFGYNGSTPELMMLALFTKPGYDSLDFSTDSPLLKQLEADRWIYGDEQVDDFTDADKEALAAELKDLYMSDYRSQWRSFLQLLHIKPFGELQAATNGLKQLADPVYSSIVAVLKVVREHTSLTPGWPQPPAIPGASSAVKDAAGKLLGKVITPTPVDIEFRELNQLTQQTEQQPAGINDILTALKELHGYFNDMAVAPNPNEAIFAAAKERYSGNAADPLRKIRVLASNAPTPVNLWLTESANHIWGVMLGGAKGQLNASWKKEVADKFNSTLANRYPLRTGGSEASQEDFNNFFMPGGVEQAFVQANIKPFLDSSGRVKAVEGQSLGISGDALAQIRTADTIRTAFFAGGQENGTSFRIRPVTLDTAVGRFELQVGDQRFEYTHGPKIPKPASWKAGRDLSVRVLFEDLNQTLHRENYEGTWSFYRLLDASGLRKVDGTRYTITIVKDTRRADYSLEADTRASGLDLGLLRSYRCPDRL